MFNLRDYLLDGEIAQVYNAKAAVVKEQQNGHEVEKFRIIFPNSKQTAKGAVAESYYSVARKEEISINDIVRMDDLETFTDNWKAAERRSIYATYVRNLTSTHTLRSQKFICNLENTIRNHCSHRDDFLPEVGAEKQA
ncbi:MAG: hypothetical protein AB7S44_01110 [Spirochaetales bacterium]